MFYKKVVSVIKIILMFIYTCLMSILGGIGLFFPEGDKKYFIFARHWAKLMLRVFKVKVNIRGLDKIKNDEGIVYVANHANMFDIWVLQANLPGELRFVGKKEILKIPIFGWIWPYSGNIPIDRKSPRAFIKSLEKAANTIKNGRCLILFPEGTRSLDGKMQEFKRGTFSIALKSNATIVPVTINGSFYIHKKGTTIINPGTVEIIIHEPIIANKKRITKEEELHLMNRIQKIIKDDYADQTEWD